MGWYVGFGGGGKFAGCTRFLFENVDRFGG